MDKSIVFNGEKSSNSVFIEISKEEYICQFINLEIGISKRFKKYIFNHFFFTNHLCLLVIDEIYLIEE